MTRRDPRSAGVVPAGALGWVVRHRAWSPYHLVRYARYLRFRLRHLGNPGVVVLGMVFLGRGVQVQVRRGYGRLVLEPWVHLGDGCRLRVHEGTMRIGEKTVFGSDITMTAYLDVEIGARCLVADDVYLTDFDHRTDDLDLPVKDQGLVKSPVRVGPDCWLGTKAVVLRGARVGAGSVVGAGAVVRGSFPERSIIAGVPARVVRRRGEKVAAPEAPTPRARGRGSRLRPRP